MFDSAVAPLSVLLTAILNIIMSILVAKGVIDQGNKDQLVQIANNTIGGLIVVLTGGYSMYKIVDIHKHKMTLTATTLGNKTTTTQTVETPIAPTPPVEVPPAPTGTGAI